MLEKAKNIFINNYGELKVWEKYSFNRKQAKNGYITYSEDKLNFNDGNDSSIVGKKQSLSLLDYADIDKTICVQVINPRALWEEASIIAIDDDCLMDNISNDELKDCRIKLLDLVDKGLLTNIRSRKNKIGHILAKVNNKDKFISIMNKIGTNNSKFKVDFSSKMEKLFSLYVSGREIGYYNNYINIEKIEEFNQEVEDSIYDYLKALSEVKEDNLAEDIKIEVEDTKENDNDLDCGDIDLEQEKANYINFKSKGLEEFSYYLFIKTGYEEKLLKKSSVDDFFNGFKSFMMVVYKNCRRFIDRETADRMVDCLRDKYGLSYGFNLDMVNNQFSEEVDLSIFESLKNRCRISKEKDTSIICYGRNISDNKYYIIKMIDGDIIEEQLNLESMCSILNSKGFYTDEFTKHKSFIKVCFDWSKISDTPIIATSLGLLRKRFDKYDIRAYISKELTSLDDSVMIVNEFDSKIINCRMNRKQYTDKTFDKITFDNMSDILKENIKNIFKSDIYGDDFSLSAGIHLLASHFVYNIKSDYMFTFIDGGGFGKDTFMQIIKSMYSDWYKWELEKSIYFKKSIDHNSIIYIEEGYIKNSNYWKQLLTSYDISCNFKYEDSRDVDFSFKQFFMSTNSIKNILNIIKEDNSIRAGSRRLFICMSNSKKILSGETLIEVKDHKLIKNLCKELANFLYTYTESFSSIDEFNKTTKEYEEQIKDMNINYFSGNDYSNSELEEDIIEFINNYNIDNKGSSICLKDYLNIIKDEFNISNNVQIGNIKKYIGNLYNIDDNKLKNIHRVMIEL